MAAGSQVEGENPLGKDGKIGGDSDAPDVKKYVTFIVTSKRHRFTAPKDKYKDVGSVLGIAEATDATLKTSEQLKRGTGYIQIAATMASGSTLRLACDPDKIGKIEDIIGKNVYGEKVKNAYIPKTQSNR
jgi:hypothetical protein